jgi:hypothetical protein
MLFSLCWNKSIHLIIHNACKSFKWGLSLYPLIILELVRLKIRADDWFKFVSTIIDSLHWQHCALFRPPFWNESPNYNKTNLPVLDSIFMWIWKSLYQNIRYLNFVPFWCTMAYAVLDLSVWAGIQSCHCRILGNNRQKNSRRHFHIIMDVVDYSKVLNKVPRGQGDQVSVATCLSMAANWKLR